MLHFPLKELGLLEKWLTLGLGQEMYTVNLGHLARRQGIYQRQTGSCRKDTNLT